ncbi:cellulose biosynthesis cyclic di-GMP-binding regulatory protein BcsB [Pseudoroseicyclus aestuarii]|uniref:Cyclic di-GMP-binding protein n=1 Tax=Pseudoroseicyclus aestuarii TaxID=1795041 RepID=A0A318T021_9RHOB|nr:cellulose biosynthesis cyclic di-GMP-binding regulatory protein BcsB [Pseudoroseicyclus aestuarii]PYE85969.1 cellulose synthase subunit [Pseudoroseicyclus aestuarii]
MSRLIRALPAAALFAALALPPLVLPAALSAQEAVSSAPVEAGLRRDIALAEIGLTQGLDFSGLSGSSELFFPIGPSGDVVTGAVLRLSLRHGQAAEAQRYLQLRAGGRILEVVPLSEEGEAAQEIEVPIPPEAMQGGFVQIGLTYGGGNSDEVCFDPRSAGDFLSIGPESALSLRLDPARLDSPAAVAALMPARSRVSIGAGVDDAAGLAFALRAAALRGGEAGLVSVQPEAADAPAAPGWTEARLRLDAAGAEQGGAVTLADVGGAPALVFSGAQPQLALAGLEAPWAGLADAPGLRVDALAPGGEAPQEAVSIPLSSLGAGLAPQDIATTGRFEIGFSIDDLPPGRLPRAVALTVGAAPSPRGSGISLSVFLNGSFLGSEAVPPGAPLRLRFALPEALVGRDNALQIIAQRQPEGGGCVAAEQGYPVQILPDSALLLGAAPRADHDFFLMRQEFAAGAAVILDTDLTQAPEALLDWLMPLAGSLLPGTGPITVTSGAHPEVEAAAEGQWLPPFLYVSDQPPGGSDPALRFDEGAAQLVDAEGAVVYGGDALERMGAVQIVTAQGRPGIWIRPGSGPAPEPTQAQPLILDRGDLALIDAEGVALALPTTEPALARIGYLDASLWRGMARQAWPWLVGVGWLLLTALALRALARRQARRRDGAEGEG